MLHLVLESAQQKQATDAALRYEKQRHAETSSFLSMVLHELKNPLSLLRVAIQHLQRQQFSI